jgi:hypothetical protein
MECACGTMEHELRATARPITVTVTATATATVTVTATATATATAAAAFLGFIVVTVFFFGCFGLLLIVEMMRMRDVADELDIGYEMMDG